MNAKTAPTMRSLALPALALFCVLAGLYSFSAGMRASTNAAITGDEPFYLLTTQSLIDDRNLDLREQYERQSYLVFFDHPDGLWKQSVPDANGRVLSPHEPGLSAFLVPGFAIGELRGAHVQLMLTAALTFALGFVLVARETGRCAVAWGATAVVGLTAPAFVYSTEIYPELPAGLCLVSSLLVLRAGKSIARPAGLALLLSAMAWLGMKYVPLGAIVAGAYLWPAPRNERWVFVSLAAGSAALYVWAHLAWFGALTPYNGNAVYEGAATSAVLESHLAFEGRWYRLWGLFIDRRFGIGRWAPVLLFIVPALPVLMVRTVSMGRTLAALIVAQVGIGTFVAITMMGWWFPGRMLMVVFPLFPLVLAVAWIRWPTFVRAGIGLAAGYSLMVTALLAKAAHGGAVRIAVDPFALDAAPFRLAGPLFPDYRLWDTETYALTVAWLVVGAIAVGFVARELGGEALVAAGRRLQAGTRSLHPHFLREASREP